MKEDKKMGTIIRILGRKGRTTIPLAIRQTIGFSYNDILSFEEGKDGNSVIIRRERLCDNCASSSGVRQPAVNRNSRRNTSKKNRKR
jgi:bifunctional DNA-binding transcriptional regulator/antitoxin component of YhaV-PrlF toxin-antitoxin module